MRNCLFFPISIAAFIPLVADEDSSAVCCELIYPSCRFETCCGFDLNLQAEGLYWVAKEQGLVYAQNGLPGPGPQTSNVPPESFNFKGNIERIDPNFDWGFRVGLGYNFSLDEWEGGAFWTYYKTDESNRHVGMLLNLWGHPDVPSSDASSEIHASWNLQYNTLDLELGRSFGAGRCFCLKPFFGITAAWIDQTLTLDNQVLLLNPEPGDSLYTDLKATSDFTGTGLRFGLDGRFDLCWGFGVYGLARYSLLYGRFDVDFLEKVSGESELNGSVDDLVIADSSDCFHMGLSALQLSMGLNWTQGFCCDRYLIGLHVGWEQLLWFQLNQMNHFQHNLSEGHLYQENGNLSLQGITFGVRFDF